MTWAIVKHPVGGCSKVRRVQQTDLTFLPEQEFGVWKLI
jgi:hypothetical protein